MVSIERGIDRFIGLFSPAAQVRRMAAREFLQRKYAAAKGKTNTGGWNPIDSNINTVISESASALRARAHQLVRDMPSMSAAVQRLDDFTVGDGITLQARVKNPETGELSKAVNTKIESAWKRWCDEADAGGRLHFNEIQQLASRQETEVGEYIFIKRFTRARGRYLPFNLLAVEPDVLTSYGATPLPGNEIHQGVEYDPRTGRAMAYHFEDADRWKKPQRYPADQVILGFRSLRPNQLRGVTSLASVILLAHQLRDYLEAEISSAQRAARWLAFITSADPESAMNAFGATQTTDANDNSYYSTEMGHAVIDFLRSGDNVTIANHNRPGDNFEPFVKFILRTFASAVGVTYELVSGDYTSSQYTQARVSRNDMLKGINIRRGRLIRQLCEPLKKEFMFWAVTTGRLNLPGYFADPESFNRSVWMAPGVEQLDPMREGRAENDAVTAKLRSPQEVLHARGRDPEQVLDEWTEWKQMLDDRGLEMPQGQSQLKTNPAAVADQGNKKVFSIAEVKHGRDRNRQ